MSQLGQPFAPNPDPSNPNIIYAGAWRDARKPWTIMLWRSEDGGRTFRRATAPHGDMHGMWINPDNPSYLIQSNDGGANVSVDGGRSWSSQFNQPTAEIYAVETDNQFPYRVYGALEVREGTKMRAHRDNTWLSFPCPLSPPGAAQRAAEGRTHACDDPADFRDRAP